MEETKVKTILALILTILASSAALAGGQCSLGTGYDIGDTLFDVNSGVLCVDCASDWPATGTQQDISFNLNPAITNATCNSSNPSTQYYRMAAHVAGYSGDGIHSFPGDCGAAAGTMRTFYPNLYNHTTNFNNYTQTDYPPMELGQTYDANNTYSCGKDAQHGNVAWVCHRWSEWYLGQSGQNGGTGYQAFVAATDAQDDFERGDIGYAGCTGKTDGCVGEDVSHSGKTGSVHGQGTQQDWVCDGTRGTVAVVDRFGNSNPPETCDMFPIQSVVGNSDTIDAPAEIYFVLPLGDATVSSSVWVPSTTADASGKYPVFADLALQTFPNGTSQWKDEWEADLYLTHSGGTKGWPLCTIEYDLHVTPCSSGTTCP